MLFQKQEHIADYTVMFPIKQGAYAETYRVKNTQGKICFLKLICCSKLGNWQIDENGQIIEVEVSRSLAHPNLCSYIEDGNLIIHGQKYVYLITEFVSNETLDQSIIRGVDYGVYETKEIAIAVLQALNYLHNQPQPIIHNEVTIQNVLLNLETQRPEDSKLIDLGYARYLEQPLLRPSLKNLNIFYLAPERFNGVCSVQSDLYSVGVLIYHLLFGQLPWFFDASGYKEEDKKEILLHERHKPLDISDTGIFELDEQLINVIKKALAEEIEERFQSADEFIQALRGKIRIVNPDLIQKIESGHRDVKTFPCKPAKGKGFSAIAGMQELKEQLQTEVIDALHHPEEYAAYGLTIPNGMLLYGPPGCGKTFFAKHFAEEVGFNFMLITPSSLKSRYVNATQENIAKMFKDAAEKAPTIIFIDEINELVPNRDSDVHEMTRSAVNEMLAQMDRTGEKSIFIIGATNYPDMIDPAILRAGRLDKKYYISPPDEKAREVLFKMYLSNRPYDFGVDYIRLSELTANYVSADIEMIVNDASRIALKNHSKITMELLENVISKTKPSVSLTELQKYIGIKAKMDGTPLPSKPENRPRIGFV